jgi:hypothetical protein
LIDQLRNCAFFSNANSTPMKKIVILIFVLAYLPGTARTTKGKEFWIAFMENLTLAFNGPPSFKLHISSDVTTTCTVSIPFTSYTSVFTVNANQVVIVHLPQGNFHPMGDEAIANNGIRVASDDSVEVKAFHHRAFFTESTLILPAEELGTDYFVMAASDIKATSPSELVILATQNNSTIEIIPSVVTVGTRPVGIPFSIVLQAGQMYQLQSYSDLTGTSVKSLDPTKKIAVFGGARQAYMGCINGGADDHVYDQVFPLSSGGKVYHAVPLLGHLYDEVKVLASLNNTTVNISGGSTYVLSKGQSVTFTISAPCEIAASNPVFVTQLATSQTCNGTAQSVLGDGGMINLVPADLTLTKTVFYTPASVSYGINSDKFPIHYLNIVVKNVAVGMVKLDNLSIPSSSFLTLSANYSFTRLTLDTFATKQHTLTCDSGFSAAVYSFISFNFYGHHLGYHKLVKKSTSGITEQPQRQTTSVFPVPAEQTIYVRSSEPVGNVDIMDLTGRLIRQVNLDGAKESELDIQTLEPGIYFGIVRGVDRFIKPSVIRFVKSGEAR